MDLNKQLSPHLPFLRQFLRALLGNQAIADAAVERLLANLHAAAIDLSPRTEVREDLYRLAFEAIDTQEYHVASADDSQAEAVAKRRMAQLSFEERAALLLTSLEGFSSETASRILSLDEATVEQLVAKSLDEFHRQTQARILLIEDEPIIAMDLETIARDLGHTLTAVAISREEAVRSARTDPPTLILADIQLADDSSGIDAVRDIQSEMDVPVIFITAFPERLLTGNRPEPAFLITKPFQRSTVKAAITQALFFHASTAPPVRESSQTEAPFLDERSIRPKIGPVDAEVERGRLVLVDSTKPETQTNPESIEAARKLHFRTAKILTDMLIGSNAAPRLHHRLNGIGRSLSRRLTQERSLQLGIQARGFEKMLADVSETLDDATLADLSVFSSDLLELVRQFPNYFAFVREAASAVPLTAATREALNEVAQTFTTQENSLVASELKEAIADVHAVASQTNDPAADLALVRTDGNVLRAIARSIVKHMAAVRQEAGSTFDKTGGRILGVALATLLIGTPVVGSLLLLQSAFPAEFGFVGALLRLAKLFLGVG